MTDADRTEPARPVHDLAAFHRTTVLVDELRDVTRYLLTKSRGSNTAVERLAVQFETLYTAFLENATEEIRQATVALGFDLDDTDATDIAHLYAQVALFARWLDAVLGAPAAEFNHRQTFQQIADANDALDTHRPARKSSVSGSAAGTYL